MKIKVMYQSKSGNTKKIADAIAQSLGQTAEAVPPAYPFENLGLLFLGAGIYAGKLDGKMTDFIRTLNVNRVKNVALFGTCAGQDTAIKLMREMLTAQGVNVVDESFICKGKCFIFFNRSHPDEKDINDAKEFAKRVVDKM